jgi:hypothetical protein
MTPCAGSNARGRCSSVHEAPNGSITPVTVPHTTGNNNRVVTVNGGRMLLDAQTGCPGSQLLLWFNPVTRAEQWLLRTPAGEAGVESVVAYYTEQNA